MKQCVRRWLKRFSLEPRRFVLRRFWLSVPCVPLCGLLLVFTTKLAFDGEPGQALLSFAFALLCAFLALESLFWRLRVDENGLNLRVLFRAEDAIRADQIDHYCVVSAGLGSQIRIYARGFLYETVPFGAIHYRALERWLNEHATGEMIVGSMQSLRIPKRSNRK